jgi:hypothetical protein
MFEGIQIFQNLEFTNAKFLLFHSVNHTKICHGRMGVILFGGHWAQYSLPEQANLTFFPTFYKIFPT